MKLIEIITADLKLDKEKSELRLESILQNTDSVDDKIIGVKNAVKEYKDSVYNFNFWVEFVESRIIQPEKQLEEEKNE